MIWAFVKHRIGGVKRESFPEQLANSIGSWKWHFVFFGMSAPTPCWFLKSATSQTIVLENQELLEMRKERWE